MGNGTKTSRKGLKICCAVTAIVVVVLVVVITTLSLTIFKPKQPEITAHPVGLENIQISFYPNVTLNVTVDMVVTIANPNYGSFKYKNATAYVNYHGDVVAEIPFAGAYVPARGKVNVTASADLDGEKLVSNPNFVNDVEAGSLNMTSTATLHGKVSMLKIFKLHAKALSSCDISIWVSTLSMESTCKSKIKL